jgi:hypothetical protein
MAALTTPEQVLARACGSTTYEWRESFYGYAPVARSSVFSAAGAAQLVQRLAFLPTLPGSLETGVTAYIPTKFECYSTLGVPAILAELINFGSINLSTGTYTNNDAMPTRTVLGSSRQLVSPVIAEVEVATNALPGSVTVSYTDQDGNAGTTAAMAISASCPVNSCGVAVLASGDVGVVDVTNVVQSGGTTPTGTLRFWGWVPISMSQAAPSTYALNTNLLAEGQINRLAASTKLGVFGIGLVTAGVTFGTVHYVGDQA